MKIVYENEDKVRWCGAYLPIPCVCGRMRLLYVRNENNVVIRVRCEKCDRDTDDSAWNFDPAALRKAGLV